MSSAGADRGVLLHLEKCAERTGLIFSCSNVANKHEGKGHIGTPDHTNVRIYHYRYGCIIRFLMEI